jgi:CRISPR-associated protein Csb1
MLNQLKGASSLLLEAELKPAQGDRFQPTGFADLGAATYTTPDGRSMLLVESAQSVANRLEKTCIDGDGPDIDPELKGLPYVAGTLTEGTGPIRTSSLVEAHRLASPYFLLNKAFKEKLAAEMEYKAARPLKWPKIYSTLFRYDPNSLIHGVFLSLLDGGRVRVARAVTGFIEAENVQKAISGGVKNSPIDPTGSLQVADAEAGEKGVYSNVPYSRIEYSAKSIKAYFNLDLALIRGYKLPEEATGLLISLALLKVRRFVTAHLRLRTACAFDLVKDVRATRPEGFALPAESELLVSVKTGIVACAGLFPYPPVTELETLVEVKPKKEKKEEKAKGTVA